MFVDTPIADCIARDVKGLYRRALSGKLPNFTGISAPYDAPLSPDIHLRPTENPAEALADQVVAALRARGVLG